MTARDRLVVIAVAAIALLGAAWLLVVSPERKKAADLNSKVSAANTELASASSQLANARQAQASYASAYASILKLGKAVPAQDEVPALIYQLAQASNQKHVEFSSIATGATAAGGAGAGAASAASASAASAATQTFTQMPFTFVFNGSFTDLYHLFHQLDAATARTASGGLRVSGRLLTVQGMKLEPQAREGGGGRLTGTITATAYVLPSSTSLTGGSTATAPAPGAASPAPSSAPAASSSAPPAVVTAGAPR